MFHLSSFDARGPEYLLVGLGGFVYTHLCGPVPRFRGYPFLDLRPEKCVGGWVLGFLDTSANSFRFCACSAGVPFTLAGLLPKYNDHRTNRWRGSRVFMTTLTENPMVVVEVRGATIGVGEGHGIL